MQRSEMLSAPLTVYWSMTNECNLRCIHCYAGATTAKSDELSTDEFKRILNELAEIKVFLVAFGGGEPMMRKDFFEILYHAADVGLGVEFSTNGTLLNKEVVDKLGSIDDLTIQVSLDGAKPETHNIIRNKQIYDKTIDAIKYLVDANIYVHLHSVVTSLNIEEIPSIIDLAVDLGVNEFRSSRLALQGRGNNLQNLTVPLTRYKELVEILYKKRDEYKDRIKIGLTGFPFLIDPDIQPQDYNPSKWNCPAVSVLCGINAEGHVLPCAYLSTYHEYETESLRDKSFKDIWQNSKFLNLFRNPPIVEECGNCSYRGTCRGGCKATVLGYYDNLAKPDPYCWQRG